MYTSYVAGVGLLSVTTSEAVPPALAPTSVLVVPTTRYTYMSRSSLGFTVPNVWNRATGVPAGIVNVWSWIPWLPCGFVVSKLFVGSSVSVRVSVCAAWRPCGVAENEPVYPTVIEKDLLPNVPVPLISLGAASGTDLIAIGLRAECVPSLQVREPKL